jgi:hypothetical protein
MLVNANRSHLNKTRVKFYSNAGISNFRRICRESEVSAEGPVCRPPLKSLSIEPAMTGGHTGRNDPGQTTGEEEQ